MKPNERVAYLRGLADGLGIDVSTKEGRIISETLEVFEDVVSYLDDLKADLDKVKELYGELDEAIESIEEELLDNEELICGNCKECFDDDEEDDDDDDDYDDDDYDFDDDDDELYEITCPTCGDTILIDEGMIDEGSMNCPNCDELLEFDYDNLTIEDFENSESE